MTLSPRLVQRLLRLAQTIDAIIEPIGQVLNGLVLLLVAVVGLKLTGAGH